MIRFLFLVLISFIAFLTTVDAAPGSYRKCYKIIKKHRRKALKDVYNNRIYFFAPGSLNDYYFKVGRYSGLVEAERMLKKKLRK